MKQNFLRNFSAGWWVIPVLSGVPVLVWIFEAPLSSRFSSLSVFTKNLGDVAGLVGFAMFALVIILSARLL